MITSIRTALSLVALVVAATPALGASPTGLQCPPQLARLQTQHLAHGSLCELYIRYHVAVTQFEDRDLGDADRISDLMAPRLINADAWNAGRASYGNDPLNFYKPAPTTWLGFERGLEMIDHLINKDGFYQTITSINAPLLQTIQRSAMTGDGLMKAGFTPGDFRHDQEIGGMLTRYSAVTPSQQNEMATGGGYKSLDGGPLLLWHPLKCFEDLAPEMQSAQRAQRNYLTWPAVGLSDFFIDAKGEKRQCGYVMYARMFEFQQQLQNWMDDLNSNLQAYAHGTMSGDPLSFLARIQRKFIMIHPFQDGNGRTSRYMLDFAARTMGLPPPVLVHLDDDIYVTEDQWASEIGEGLWHYVEVIEACTKNPKALGCNVLPDRPEVKRLQISDLP